MDEMIGYDLPAMIDYIIDKTSHSSIAFVGHSFANTLMLALLSTEDRYSNKIEPYIALAPYWYNVDFHSIVNQSKWANPYLM